MDARASTARAADPNRPLTDAVALAATRDRRRIVAPDMSRSVVCGSPGYSICRSRNRTGIVKKSEEPARSMRACGARAVGGMTTPTDGGRGRGRSGGRGRGRGDRSRGGSRSSDPKVRLSKNLSQILRHGVVDEGLVDCLDAEGFVPLARVLALPRFRGIGADEIRALVAADRKGRFELRDRTDGTVHVRATQGHTLRGDVLDDDAVATRLTRTSGIREAVHGTSMRAWERIRTHGLSRMRRRHVHMATGLPGDGEVRSGMRNDCEVAVWVDVERGVAEGVPFYVSANGVVLSPGEGDSGIVPARLFLRAHRIRGGEELPL